MLTDANPGYQQVLASFCVRRRSTQTYKIGCRDFDITEIDITESDVTETDITESDITESDITESDITRKRKLL